MKLIEDYIKEILKEDVTGFAREMSGVASTNADTWDDGGHYQARLSKPTSRAIKTAFRNNADHQWLKTLDTVHWTLDAYGLSPLPFRNRDELSTTMTLSGESFTPAPSRPIGLWVRGRITLAAADMDNIWSGHHSYYMPNSERDAWTGEGSPNEKQLHRSKSSGVNKLPLKGYKPDVYSRIGRYVQTSGDKVDTKLLSSSVPYIFDQESWNALARNSKKDVTNEALVDNWRPVGIVVADPTMANYFRKMSKDDVDEMIGSAAVLVKAAQELRVPIFDVNKKVIWEV